MGNLRIYQLSQELGIPNEEIMEYLKAQGEPAKSHFSTIDDDMALKVKTRFVRPSGKEDGESEEVLTGNVTGKSISVGRDRRRYERYTIKGVAGTMVLASEVQIVDISLGGICVEVNRRMNMNAPYTITLNRDGKKVRLTGRVIRSSICRSKVNDDGDQVPIYSAVIQFSDTFSEKATELMDFIRGSKDSLENRLDTLRFVVEGEHSATLDCPVTYKVKKISLGGLLLESNYHFGEGTIQPMRIQLRKDVTLEFTGRIAFCYALSDKKENKYDVGIEFVEMSDGNRMLLKNFVNSLSA